MGHDRDRRLVQLMFEKRAAGYSGPITYLMLNSTKRSAATVLFWKLHADD